MVIEIRPTEEKERAKIAESEDSHGALRDPHAVHNPLRNHSELLSVDAGQRAR
jgi:hypothetical protein